MEKNRLKQKLLVVLLGFSSLTVYSQEYFSRIGMEGVDLIGSITFGMIDKYTRMQPGFYSFDYEKYFQPEVTNPILPVLATGGSTYHDGKIYCNEYTNEQYAPEQKPRWKIYDAETFQLLSEIALKDNYENTTTSLAYDVTTDKIYGYVEDFYGYFSLVEIDSATGAMTRIGELDRKYIYSCLACNKKGQLFGICINTDSYTGDTYPYLVKFRKSDGKMAIVGEIKAQNLLSSQDLLIIMSSRDQALFFDNSSDRLYWMLPSSSYALASEYTAITEVNVVNATATLVSYLLSSYRLSGAFLKEPPFTAPSIVSDFQFVPKSESTLSGVLKFKIPDVCYGGEELKDEQVSVIVKEDGNELVNVKTKPGMVFTSKEITFSNDEHHITIAVKNESGEGPVIQRSFYVGYDIPKAPQNIVLTNDGLKTILTWEPPVEGVHGAVINPKDYTYKVIRYPYEITVAEGLNEFKFVEEHPEEMTRYVYEVMAVDGNREGERGYSNNLIIGTPLNLPYGGIFKGPADMYNYYTILDENEDGFSWLYDFNTASAFYTYNPVKDADDWLISPPINYKKNTEYILKFKAYSSMAGYPESMEVKMGRGKTPESQTQLLLDIPEVPSVSEDSPVTEYETVFTVEEDGVYYYGFHAKTPKFHEYLFLFDIRVAEKNPSLISNYETVEPIRIQTDKGYIHIDNQNQTDVLIYNSNGGIVLRSKDALIKASLPTGIYLIQIPGKAYKVAIF